MPNTLDWARLAVEIRRRREQLGLTRLQLGESAGTSGTTIKNLEGARDYTRVPKSLGPIEDALGWREGSMQAVLEGGDPIPREGSAYEGVILRRATLRGRVLDGLMTVLPQITAQQLRDAERSVMQALEAEGVRFDDEPMGDDPSGKEN